MVLLSTARATSWAGRRGAGREARGGPRARTVEDDVEEVGAASERAVRGPRAVHGGGTEVGLPLLGGADGGTEKGPVLAMPHEAGQGAEGGKSALAVRADHENAALDQHGVPDQDRFDAEGLDELLRRGVGCGRVRVWGTAGAGAGEPGGTRLPAAGLWGRRRPRSRRHRLSTLSPE